jgi:hypothetical protein
VPEPENPAVAVMVDVQGGRGLYRLGYVPRTLIPMAAVLGNRLPALRLVEGGSIVGERWYAWRCKETVRGKPRTPRTARGKGCKYGLQVF